jgi:DNA polymerase-3 subunit beta
MRLETKASILTNALRLLNGVVERRNTIPILGCVKIDGRTVVGTDLDIEIEIKLPASVAQGTICIDHRSLFVLLRNVPGDDDIRIEGDGSTATVTFSTGRYDLPSLPVADWPTLTTEGLVDTVLDGEAFKRSLAFVSPFISTEETRYYLNGVCLDGSVAVTTDGHRLACHPLGADLSAFDRPIIPRKAVRLLQSIPAATQVSIGRNRLAATLDGARLVTKLIDGTFPDWRRAVPVSSDKASRLTISPRGVRRTMSRVTAVMGRFRAYVTIAFDGHGMAVVGEHGDGAIIREFVSGSSLVGKGQIIAFQSNYLRDLLNVFIDDDQVGLTIVDAGSPIRIDAGKERFAILMPARASSEQLASEALAEWATAQSIGRAA